jgi:hypothetical protein
MASSTEFWPEKSSTIPRFPTSTNHSLSDLYAPHPPCPEPLLPRQLFLSAGQSTMRAPHHDARSITRGVCAPQPPRRPSHSARSPAAAPRTPPTAARRRPRSPPRPTQPATPNPPPCGHPAPPPSPPRRGWEGAHNTRDTHNTLRGSLRMADRSHSPPAYATARANLEHRPSLERCLGAGPRESHSVSLWVIALAGPA